MGSLLIACGVIVIVVGALTFTGLLKWFGHLPGDIHYSGGNVRVYFPIVTMLLISLGLSIFLAIIRRLR